MSVFERFKAVTNRTSVSEWFDCLAANESGAIFFEDGSLGAMLRARPTPYVDEKSYMAFKQVLSEDYPPGTILQFIQVAYPDLDDTVETYVTPRHHSSMATPIAKALAMKRAEFVRAGETKPAIPGQNILAMESELWITLRMPVKGVPFPKDEEVTNFQEMMAKIAGSMESAGLRCRQLDGRAEYLEAMRRCFDMYGRRDARYDEQELLRKQIAPPGLRVTTQLKTVRLPSLEHKGRTYAKTMSTRRYPSITSLSSMNYLGGVPDGIGAQIGVPNMITTTIHIPDQTSKIGAVRMRASVINQQAFGPMLKWAPILVAKKNGFDCIGRALDDGDKVMEVATTLTVFHPNRRTLEKIGSRVKSMLTAINFDMTDERFIAWPTLLNSLPLGASSESIKGTRRFKTMTAKHAACLLPVMGDWEGYGNAMLLQTRRGRPFFYDFFDKQFNSNYNWILVAESGAGKSFKVQRIIQDYMSLGTQMWVVDRGRSHTKTTKAQRGQVIEFSANSNISLNPFTHVEDIDEDIGMLTALVAKMCRPSQSTGDEENSYLMEAIKSSWNTNGNQMSIDDIQSFLMKQEHETPRVLGRMIFPFSSQGPYGSWFAGPNNLDMSAPLVTLELKDLESQPVLQQVVLLQLIVSVQQAMYRGDDSVKKMMIVEECADLMKDEGFARFLAEAYAKVRKHKASMGIVLQNLSQLYKSSYGAEISASASTMMIMEQKSETITRAKKEGWLDMSDGAFDLLKSVHTRKDKGGYSEIFFYTPGGCGIARLVESRFNQVLFSTEGLERTEVLAAIENGVPAVEAVEQFMARHH